MFSDADHSAALGFLANGVIPPDHRDDGAAGVNCGERLAGKMLTVYSEGVVSARRLAEIEFGKPLLKLDPSELEKLLDRLRVEAPAFYKQLRLDVTALYLSDPKVWTRIGFPGPSAETGGYPDFDQPQMR